MTERLRRERAFWDRLYARRTANDYQPTFAERYVDSAARTSQLVYERLSKLPKQLILSIGGGVDRLGVALGRRGHTVVTVDVSAVAAIRTRELAHRNGVHDLVIPVVGDCESFCFRAGFDVVLCKRSLHHMDLQRVVVKAIELLREGGLFIAEEPICLLPVVRWLHRKAPFHPDPVRTEDESELTRADVVFIRDKLDRQHVHYLDMMTRESITYLVSKAGLEQFLVVLSNIDYRLVNHWCPLLRYLSSYVVLEGYKPTGQTRAANGD